MGEIFFLFIISIIHVSLLLNSVIAVYQEKGFSLKMIHIDSKESPLYPGDHLTRGERIQRLVEQSKAQARYIESQILLPDNVTLSMNPDVVRLPMVYESIGFYVAMVGLGTFRDSQNPFKKYYLIIDTGSSRTWLQCEGASKYFDQDMPLYPWNSSTTYRPVLCDTHPLCNGDMCNADGQCTYKIKYGSGQVTSGILAVEKFTLGSNTGGDENINLEMGCGFRQVNFKYIGKNHLRRPRQPNLIAGMLGLGSGPWSFLNQLGAAGGGKLSHCFEEFKHDNQGLNTYLRFGADATIGGPTQEVRTTPIIVPPFQSYKYYLNLEDITVGRKKANFPEGTFELKSQKEGGFMIDSGTTVSMIYKDHFDRVADLVKEHFIELGAEYIGARENFKVCFRLRRGFGIHHYPSIILHFQNANYVISNWKANFVVMTLGHVCFGYIRKDTNGPAFILGAMQQTNKRILYNTMERSLSFAEEYCTLNS